MRKFAIFALSCVLTSGFTFAGEISAADQKWLSAVEKMIADGKTTVSTPSKERADILKEWAGKKGYAVELTKSDKGFQAKLSKKLASN